MGLCWMLKDEYVIALTAEARLSGGLSHYRRRTVTFS
jgi:hypothetical protein